MNKNIDYAEINYGSDNAIHNIVNNAKKDTLYNDSNFLRDEKVNKMINIDYVKNKDDYIPVVNSILQFKKPVNSNDMMENIDYKQINTTDKYIYEIFNMMGPNNKEQISKDELTRIQGGINIKNEPLLSTFQLQPKPVYSNFQ